MKYKVVQGKEGKCPKCRQKSVCYSEPQAVGNVIEFNLTCDNCGLEYVEQYTVKLKAILIPETE